MLSCQLERKKSSKCFWNVLHVVANHERRVARHLEARSVEHYLPLYKEQSQWTDRRVTVERPLFVGYVFARYTPEEKQSLRSVPSVLHVLGNGDDESVSAEEIERIRLGLQNGYALRPYVGVAEGMRVRVGRGIFKGEVGIVTKICRQCKVILLLRATGQRFSLEISGSDVEVLDKQCNHQNSLCGENL